MFCDLGILTLVRKILGRNTPLAVADIRRKKRSDMGLTIQKCVHRQLSRPDLCQIHSLNNCHGIPTDISSGCIYEIAHIKNASSFLYYNRQAKNSVAKRRKVFNKIKNRPKLSS
jgi:hypothetical protein